MVEFELEQTPWQKFCADVWWLVLLQGLAAFALGTLLLIRPRSTVLILVQLLGVFFLIDGIFILIKSLLGRRTLGIWGWGVAIGTLSMLAGVVVLGHPLASAVLTAAVLVTFLALAALGWGLISLLTGIRLRGENRGEWSMILGGLFSLGIAALLLSRPLFTVMVLSALIAIIALLNGLFLLILAVKLRKAYRA